MTFQVQTNSTTN